MAWKQVDPQASRQHSFEAVELAGPSARTQDADRILQGTEPRWLLLQVDSNLETVCLGVVGVHSAGIKSKIRTRSNRLCRKKRAQNNGVSGEVEATS